MRNPIGTLLVVALAISTTACSSSPPATEEAAATAEAEVVDPAAAVVTDEHGTRVTLSVTDDGFVPERVTVPAGKPVTLVVTRKTERTCATELVMKEHDINQPLPLNETVEITFTPAGPGELRYACAMDMIAGTIVVQ